MKPRGSLNTINILATYVLLTCMASSLIAYTWLFFSASRKFTAFARVGQRKSFIFIVDNFLELVFTVFDESTKFTGP